MTREEAIAILNHNVSACLHGTEWGEALDMAIEALEQHPCDDAISRQAVIDATTKYCVLYDLRELLADIETLPSVSTEKTGRWIEDVDENREWDRVRFYCSRCEDWNTYGKTKYCPNCGARMAESEE